MRSIGRFRAARIVSKNGLVVFNAQGRLSRITRMSTKYLPISVHKVIAIPRAFLRDCLATILPVRGIIVDRDTNGLITSEVLEAFPNIEIVGITSSRVDISVIDYLLHLSRLQVVSFANSILPSGSKTALKSLGNKIELNLDGAIEEEPETIG